MRAPSALTKYAKTALWATSVGTLVALAACGSTPKNMPVDLPRLEATAVQPKVLWKRDLGSANIRGSHGFVLATQGDFLYAIGKNGALLALNKTTGNILWQKNTRLRVSSGPALVGEKLVIGTLDAEVVAFAVENNPSNAAEKPIWRSRVSSEVIAPIANTATNVVVRTIDGRTHSLQAETGQRSWGYDRTIPSLTQRGTPPAVIGRDSVLLAQDTGKLALLQADTGKVTWEQTISAPEGKTEIERLVDLDATPLFIGDDIYAQSLQGELAAVSATTGRVLWRKPIKGFRGIAADSGRVYTLDSNSVLYGVERGGGNVVWKQDKLLNRRLSAPTIWGDYLVVGDYEGYIHLFALRDGQLVTRIRATSHAILHAPQVIDNKLYVLDTQGDVAALSL